MGASATLKKIANAREKAYRLSGFLTANKAKSISKVRNVAEFFSQKSEAVQLRAVLQCESEIIQLLPHPDSRFGKMRTDMLELIEKAKQFKRATEHSGHVSELRQSNLG
jgi:thiamine biosynthesis lipoprotein ApbE